jgi:hypothetical protein
MGPGTEETKLPCIMEEESVVARLNGWGAEKPVLGAMTGCGLGNPTFGAVETPAGLRFRAP